MNLSVVSGIVSVDPAAGQLVGQGQFPVTVTFDTTTRPVGVYTDQIQITSNDPLTPVLTVPVTLPVTLALPGAPSNPTPEDGAGSVRIDQTLGWDEAAFAASYDLYYAS